MTQSQENTHAMHADVLAVLDAGNAAWKSRKPTGDQVAALREAHAAIAETDAARESLRPEGLTQRKAALRTAMVAQAVALVQTVRPYGRATGDAALVEAVDLTPTDFNDATEEGVISLAERVLRAAEPHTAALPEYGSGDPAALRAAVEAFRPARGARDATRSQREAKTRELPPLFDAADAAIAMLDDLVPGLGDAELTAEYRRARRIDDV